MTVIGIAESSMNGSTRYKLRCQCGGILIRTEKTFLGNKIRNCPECCHAPSNCTGAAWRAMIRAAKGNFNHEWMKYDNFVRDMGPCPYGCTIDRLNKKRPWKKDNCVWVKRRNKSAVLIEVFGIAMSLSDWAYVANRSWASVSRIIKGGNQNKLLQYPKVRELLYLCGKLPDDRELHQTKAFEPL